MTIIIIICEVNRLISFGNKKCDIEYIKRKGVYGIVNECNHVFLIKSNNKLILPGGELKIMNH
jgi:hypothetical protein